MAMVVSAIGSEEMVESEIGTPESPGTSPSLPQLMRIVEATRATPVMATR
jgi:hypothetical protein